MISRGCFRCGTSVVRQRRGHYDGLSEAADGVEEGILVSTW